MKTDSKIRLTRTQYRALAEKTKAAGMGLLIEDYDRMGVWGYYDPMAKEIIADCSSASPRLVEKSCATLSTTIDLGELRRVQRPEIDWNALEDHEVYEFVCQHEIGHRADNYCLFSVYGIEDPSLQARLQGLARMVNEVLADRYAWAQVRPGEVLPLCEEGKRRQQEVADAFEFLNLHIPRVRRQPYALPGGQYQNVPARMLKLDAWLAYVGTKVHPHHIENQRKRIYRRDPRTRTSV